MSIKNGVWHDAHLDPPESNTVVLAIKQLKNGTLDICLARCFRDYAWRNPATGVIITEDRWCCGGNNNIIYWMPLPEIPEK